MNNWNDLIAEIKMPTLEKGSHEEGSAARSDRSLN